MDKHTGDRRYDKSGEISQKEKKKERWGGGLNGEEYLEDRWIRRENRVIEQRIQRKGG